GEGELSGALRHGDGAHAVALLVVRDDFALAATDCFARLEIPLLQGRNFAAIDCFEVAHARTVLAAFGRADGRLPSPPEELTDGQREFLDRAAAGLAEGGEVVPVRLELFAEMLRNRPWTPAELRAVGGTEGLGVAFLESVFSSPEGNPGLRARAEPARAILRALLPPPGVAIRSQLQPAGRLRE